MCLSCDPKSTNDVSTICFNHINTTVQNYLLHKNQDKAIRVAVLDTGFDKGHEDFQQSRTKDFQMTRDDISNPVIDEELQHERIVACRDFCDDGVYIDLDDDNGCDDVEVNDFEDDDIEDFDGHGTQVAGIILRLVPHAKLLIARVCLGNRNCKVPEQKTKFMTPQSKVVAQAIRWAIKKRVHIINLSFGFRHYPKEKLYELRSALEEAQLNKIVVFAATSNEGAHECVAWPASDRAYAIGVHSCKDGGSAKSDTVALPSDNADNFMVVGERIISQRISSQGGGFSLCTGSSFATPVAASIGALVLSFVEQAICYEEREEAAETVHLDDIRTNQGMIKVLRAISTRPDKPDYLSLSTKIFWADYRPYSDSIKDEYEAKQHAWLIIKKALRQ